MYLFIISFYSLIIFYRSKCFINMSGYPFAIRRVNLLFFYSTYSLSYYPNRTIGWSHTSLRVLDVIMFNSTEGYFTIFRPTLTYLFP